MIKINRDIAIVVNWCLDNLVPPFLRDFRPFMKFIIRFAYGDKTELILDFKDKVIDLSEENLSEIYEAIKNVPVNMRPTDLSTKAFNFVLASLVGNSIFDAACGRGHLANSIAKHDNMTVAALDLVNTNKTDKNVQFIEGNITNIPLPDSSFDTVICAHALEHIIEPKLALKEILRVTKKRTIIVVPRQREYKYTPDLHVNFFPYLHNIKSLINIPHAIYHRLLNEWICVIDKCEIDSKGTSRI